MPHKILIADDDTAFRQVLEQFLGDTLKYDVTGVETSKQALEAAMAARFDLCLIDVTLDDGTGSELFGRLRRHQPDIEAILFTPEDTAEHTRDHLRFSLPAERVLRKPLSDLSTLTRLIIGILGPPTLA